MRWQGRQKNQRNLENIFRPHRIALIGTEDAPDLGTTLLKNLTAGGFTGALYPIDAERDALLGIPTFPDLEHVPHTPDLALICGPAASVPEQVRQCGEAGISGIIVFSPGFRESGAAGAALEREIARIAADFENLRILGPNSLGIIAPHSGLNASLAVAQPTAGHLAFVSQSRALCNSIIDWATDQGIGFSHFVSIGNMLDVGFGDLIDYFDRDPHTRAIILYVQSIEHARRFMSAARAFARSKPIVACKAGRFGESARAAASHTGFMVAEDAVYGAAFERAGVVRVRELDDVFDVAELLTARRLPKGPRLVIVSNAGGPAVIAADALLGQGGILAQLDPQVITRLDAILPAEASRRNPIDLLDEATAEHYVDVTRAALDGHDVDAVLVIYATQSGGDSLSVARAVAEVAEGSNKPVLAAWMGGNDVRPGIRSLNEAGVATHSTPEQAVRAFMHLVSYARNLEDLYETPRDLPVRFEFNRRKLRRKLRPLLRGKRSDFLTERQAQAMLKAYQIPLVESSIARTSDEAVRAATGIGFPVALKISSLHVVHKVDVGGVALDVNDPEEAAAAFEALAANAQRHSIAINGIGVQKMVKAHDSIELILGAKKDPTFGAVIMVGSGGVAAEIVQDRALALPPLNERHARRMLESLRLWPILQGYRGQPAVNLDRLIEVIMRFSCLITDYPEIREFEINPLLVTPQDVIALDAVGFVDTQVSAPLRDPHSHLAIRPYPEEYLHRARLKDGTQVTLRSVRPEDETSWHELIAASSEESIRFRFRSLFKKTTHRMAIEHCFIDYEREIGIVAEIRTDGATRLIGLAHLLSDVTRNAAEFAVIVGDAWQGKGLGGMLLDYCLELARRRGFRRVVAETDPENRPMLALFSSRGFILRVRPEDDVVYLEKPLDRRARRAARRNPDVTSGSASRRLV
jgi:acetyltransferase